MVHVSLFMQLYEEIILCSKRKRNKETKKQIKHDDGYIFLVCSDNRENIESKFLIGDI